jgi:uncharacterized protein YbbK (DUF523 family)
MIKVLVSSCLLGAPVRYNGKDKKSSHRVLDRWAAEGRIISVCPEVQGGLGVPRPPAEIVQIGGLRRVITNAQRDVTAEFEKGAISALDAAMSEGARIAVLKEGSPSCGRSRVYDGTFSQTSVPGEGIATALLRQHGIAVFSEDEIDAADACISRMERGDSPQ